MEGGVELDERDAVPPANSQDEAGDQYPEGIRLLAITIALVLSIFLSALDSTILATAIPKITFQFHSLADVGWYSSAYAISNASFQSTFGKAYRYFPLKRVYLCAVGIFELGNLICALAPNSPAVIIGRIIAGAGGAGIMSGVFIIIAFTAKPKYKAAYFGVLGVTFGCSSVVGPLMGGALADGPGWRYCFW
jgi:MFS transporter, DHA2 family, glioxin efflux transporter